MLGSALKKFQNKYRSEEINKKSLDELEEICSKDFPEEAELCIETRYKELIKKESSLEKLEKRFDCCPDKLKQIIQDRCVELLIEYLDKEVSVEKIEIRFERCLPGLRYLFFVNFIE